MFLDEEREDTKQKREDGREEGITGALARLGWSELYRVDLQLEQVVCYFPFELTSRSVVNEFIVLPMIVLLQLLARLSS